jgi:opacity protein-like surface antigen
MKKIFSIFLVAVATVLFVNVAGAQERGQQAVGLNFEIGSGESYTNYGLGFKYQYNIMDNFRVEPSFTYFFKKDHATTWDMTANLHYLIAPADQMYFYPIVGFGLTNVDTDWSDSNTKFAFNFGFGAEYMITDVIGLNCEYKYRIVDNWSRSHFTFGAVFKF